MTLRGATSVCGPVKNPWPRSKSFRLFPLRLSGGSRPGETAGSRYLEYTPDRLILYHSPQDQSHRIRGTRRAELQISLDVLELLAGIHEGSVPSPDDIRGVSLTW